MTLKDGTEIWASAIHIQDTFTCVQEGVSTARSNSIYLGHFRTRVERIFNGSFPVYIVQPKRTPDPKRKDIRGEPAEDLPDHWCAAEFYDRFMRSCLVVVWFQESLLPLSSEEARPKIEAIEWELRAEEFTP